VLGRKEGVRAFLHTREGVFIVAQQLNKMASEFTDADWGAIANNPKFRELSRRKMSFLIGWWLFSTIFYFCLPIAAGYTTSQSDFFNTQIIGHVPLLYLFALAQYGVCLFIAIYYHYWANKHADRLTGELLDELKLR
jgi:uncharacterized membrane protein (DUF485 family)